MHLTSCSLCPIYSSSFLPQSSGIGILSIWQLLGLALQVAWISSQISIYGPTYQSRTHLPLLPRPTVTSLSISVMELLRCEMIMFTCVYFFIYCVPKQQAVWGQLRTFCFMNFWISSFWNGGKQLWLPVSPPALHGHFNFRCEMRTGLTLLKRDLDLDA